MKVASLEAYGAHADVLAAWTKQYDAELLPIQQKAVVEGKVLDGANLVGSGPTGCGKTFIAEMAATHAAGQGRKAVYLVPTKALAEALYARFCRVYGPLGLRVDISTQDRRGADRRIARGEFDLAVTVPEKLWSVILGSPALVSGIGALVVDELQTLGDPDRGQCLELLLARFLQAGGTQLVGLSAVLGNGPEIARWLGARLVEESSRPVELRKGVWREGVFQYREHNSGGSGEEELGRAGDEEQPGLGAIAALAASLAERNEPTLVFLRDRLSSVHAAREAASLTDSERARGALESLRELPRTQATTALAELMQCGVAFHNADLHFSERQVVEEAFAAGELGCLFCTTTLAVGVNLPARNVIIEPLKWRAESTGAPSLTAMSQAEFENMAGRAGRLGLSDDFGRAILLGAGGFDADSLTRRYIQAGPEPVEGQLGRLPELRRFLLVQALDSDGGSANSEPRLFSPVEPPSAELADLAEGAGLAVRSVVTGSLQLTGVGRAAAASGLSTESLMSLTRTIDHLGRAPTNLEALILAAMSWEARSIPLPRDRRQGGWIAHLEERARGESGWSDHTRGVLWGGPLRAGEREQAARIAMLALEWTGRETTADLELRTGVHAGRAAALCETAGWLVQCAANLAEEMAGDPTDVARLRQFGEALSAAVPEDCMELARLRLASVQRDHVLALHADGIGSLDDLAQAENERLRAVLPAQALAEVRAAVARWRKASTRAGGSRECRPAGDIETIGAVCVPETLLVVDRGRPDIAMVNGEAVSLSPMEFQLLSLLAKQPRRCVSFDRIYDALWGSREAVEPQQIYYHRHNLSKKLRQALPTGAEEPIRTLSRRGLMLDLPADRVNAA